MRVRVRDHVNPFSPAFSVAPEPLNFAEAFANPSLPLHLDLGCALGQFILKMAHIQPETNFLGVDIREQMIERAKRLAAKEEINNLHYQFCNATISIESLLQNMPSGVLQTVTIQFPDPHLKKRLNKRRMVQPRLVEDLSKYCAGGAKIFVQSDIEEVAVDICDKFEQHGNFRHVHEEAWLAENPFQVKTERETVVETQGLKVYRAMFERKIS